MTAAAFDQDSFRFRRDVDPTASGWLQAVNTNMGIEDWHVSYQFGTTFRVRFLIQETAGGMQVNFECKLQYNHNAGGWTDVTTTSSVVKAVTTTHYTQDDDSTQQIGSGTFISANSGMSEDGTFGTAGIEPDFTGNTETEFECALQLIEADCLFGDTIALRVVEADGTALDVYSNEPTITVPVITTLGQANGHDTAMTISSTSGTGPYTVTVGTDETDGMLPGDALYDETAVTPRRYLIYRVLSGTQVVVIDSEAHGSAPDNSGGTSPTEFSRYYNATTPIADFETGLDDTDLYSNGDYAIGEFYNDATFTENAFLVMNGGASITLGAILLTAVDGERHTGKEGTGVTINHGFSLTDNVVKKASEWLEIDANDNTSLAGGGFQTIGISKSKTHCIRNNIIHKFLRGETVYGVEVNGGALANVLNNLIYDIQTQFSGSKNAYGLESSGSGGRIAFNNTVHDLAANASAGATTGVIASQWAGGAENNIATDCEGGGGSGSHVCFDSDTNQVTNLSSDTTAVGTALDSKNSVDQFVANASPYDLRLKSGADAIAAGTDQGTTPTGVQFDIENYDRHEDPSGYTSDGWDVGAHQFTVAAGGAADDAVFFGAHF